MTVVAGPLRVRRAVSGGRGAAERDQLGRIPLDLWAALAGDTEARARYYRKVYWRGPGQCAFFLGALGTGGHGRGSGPAPAGRSPTGRAAWSSRRTSTATCSAGASPAWTRSPGCSR